MDLTPYVDSIRQDLAVAADSGGPEARTLAERLTAPLESALHLALLEALSAAAAEITLELAPGSVDVRLRGREPSFVVTLPPAEREDMEPDRSTVDPPPRLSPDGEDGGMARINLRLSEDLKGRVEEAARQAGLSTNAWLVRAAAATLEPEDRPAPRQSRSWGGDRYTGWVR